MHKVFFHTRCSTFCQFVIRKSMFRHGAIVAWKQKSCPRQLTRFFTASLAVRLRFSSFPKKKCIDSCIVQRCSYRSGKFAWTSLCVPRVWISMSRPSRALTQLFAVCDAFDLCSVCSYVCTISVSISLTMFRYALKRWCEKLTVDARVPILILLSRNFMIYAL